MRIAPLPPTTHRLEPVTADSPRLVSLPAVPNAALVAGYLVCYVALDWISYIDPLGSLGITPWNPPPGLSLFMLLRYGLRFAPWLFVAALLAELLVRGAPAPWPWLVLISALLALGYAGLAMLLRERFRFNSELATLRDATVFTASVTVATGVIAILYVAVFAAAGILAPGTFVRSVSQFWIGDLIGIIITTPVLLVASRHQDSTRIRPFEQAAQALAIVASLAVVFHSGLEADVKFFYVLFLPIIWVAMRRGVAGTAWAILLVQLGLIAALRFRGYAPGEVLDFQYLMLTLALTGLFLGVTVAERRAAVDKLRDKQFELDRSLRAAAASELASALAHELNQPLSAVSTYARACQVMLSRHGEAAPELVPTLDKVVAEANRAATVVRRLRELVRTGTVRQEALEVGMLLEHAAVAARPRGERHGVIVAVIAPGDLPAARGDRVQLETVLHNLIGNAIDALKTISGPRTVRLSAAADGASFIRLSVADDGPGVAPDVAATLFQPLASDKAQGLGLGLAISRTIVEAHGGRLWLENVPAGACFCLTLPTT
jgi:two-component system sensor kinase FixL